MSNKLLFKKGSYADLKANVITNNKATEGAFYVTEDEGCLYLGQTGGTLKRIQGSVLFFDTLTRFENEVVKAPPYSTDVIYFVAAENALVRYTGSEWKVLNADPAEVSTTLTAIQQALDKALPKAGGTMTGDITMSDNKTIKGVPTPSADTDAANKKYVDDAKNTLLGTSGDTAGATTIHGALKAAKAADDKAAAAQGTANAAQGAANAAQGTADAALPKAGGTMTGEIAMSNKKITGLATPTESTDAANKQYVDDAKTEAKNYADAQIAANDAMTFKGVLDSSHSLPDKANVGDTYKVGEEGKYGPEGAIAAKVGDLIINNANNDIDTPNWVHISSGYEDDYLQKLGLSSDGKTIYITDGVNTDYDSTTSALKNKKLGSIKVLEDAGTNIKVTTVGDTSVPNNITITVSMEWGSFASPTPTEGQN